MSLFQRFITEESGATAIEYGLIAAIIAVGIIVALNTVEDSLTATFTDISDELGAAR